MTTRAAERARRPKAGHNSSSSFPPFNEEENLPNALRRPRADHASCWATGSRIFIVDDGSADDDVCDRARPTPARCRSSSSGSRQPGPGRGVPDGLQRRRSHCADPDALIVTLEADTTSDLDALPQMLDEVRHGADVVLADWRMVGVSAHRRLLSAAAGWVVRREPRARGDHGFVVLPRLPRVDAPGRLDPLRRPPDPRARLRLQGGAAREARLRWARASSRCPSRSTGASANGESKMPVFKTMLAYWRMLFRERSERSRTDSVLHRRRTRRMKPSVGIVGGGILGMTAAYRLAQAGVAVSLYERAPRPGRARRVLRLRRRRRRSLLPRRPAERRPGHRPRRRARARRQVALPADQGRLLRRRAALLDDLAEGVPDVSTAPPARAGPARAFVARCQLIKEHDELDDEPLHEWLAAPLRAAESSRSSGSRCSTPSSTATTTTCPATYIWARTRRMGSTRDKSGREVMGWLEGGYQTLIDALEEQHRALGGVVHAGATVEQIAGRRRPRASVSSSTVACAVRSRSLHAGAARWRAGCSRPSSSRRRRPTTAATSASSACSLRVKRSVSPYYHLNITDRRVPLTTVVETTHVVDPERVGGHLLYVSKYVDPGTPTTSALARGDRADSSWATRARSSRTCATTRSLSRSCSGRA